MLGSSSTGVFVSPLAFLTELPLQVSTRCVEGLAQSLFLLQLCSLRQRTRST